MPEQIASPHRVGSLPIPEEHISDQLAHAPYGARTTKYDAEHPRLLPNERKTLLYFTQGKTTDRVDYWLVSQ